MEAYKDVIFQGDEIIWQNLFRHYIACFLKEYMRFALNNESMNNVDIKYKIDYSTYDFFDGLKNLQNNFNKISNEFIEYFNKEITRILEFNKIDKNKLIFFLYSFNTVLLRMIENEVTSYSKKDYKEIKSMRLLLEQYLKIVIRRQYDINIISTVNNKLKFNTKNTEFLQFTEEYVNGLIKHFYPYEYIASFSTKYDNHVVWSHYTNNHEGVCLIYKNNIKFLNELDNNTIFDNKLYKVKYTNNIKTSSFFKDMYYNEYKEYMDFWNLDTDGKRSILYRKKDLSYKDNINYKNLFNRYTKKSFNFLTQKLKHWKYENEYRLIMLSYYYQRDKKYKLMKYDFNSLDGIIFGMKTSLSDKLKIIEIVENLCKQHNRKEFNFYQAYSNEYGEICKENLHISLNINNVTKDKEHKEYSNFI